MLPCGMKRICISLVLGLLMFSEQTQASSNENPTNRLVVFSSKRLAQLLASAGLPDTSVRKVSRNADGTKVFIECPGRTNGTTTLLIISTNGATIRHIHGLSPILGEDEQVVSLVVDHVLSFQDGNKIKLSPYTRQGFTPEAQHFFFYHPDEGTSVRRVAEPNKPLLNLEKGFIPQDIFEHENRIFVFGHLHNREKSQSTTQGLILLCDANGYSIERKIDLSWAGGVRDMEVNGGVLLVEGRQDLLPPWTLYNLNTEKRTPLGIAKEYGLFLTPSLRSVFEK
jgi:hypothetical protein